MAENDPRGHLCVSTPVRAEIDNQPTSPSDRPKSTHYACSAPYYEAEEATSEKVAHTCLMYSDGTPMTIVLGQHAGKWRFYLSPHVSRLMDEAGVVPAVLRARYWSLEPMWYIMARWLYLDHARASLFEEEFELVRMRILRLLILFDEAKMLVRRAIVQLLLLVGERAMVNIQGTRHEGIIVAFYDPPFSRRLPISVRFESLSHQGSAWTLTMASIEDNDSPGSTDHGLYFSSVTPELDHVVEFD